MSASRWFLVLIITAVSLLSSVEAWASSSGGTIAMSPDKSPYYTDFAQHLQVGAPSYTYWTLQAPPYKYKWNGFTGLFEKYSNPATDTELNDGYNAKTRQFITDATNVIFLCPKTESTFGNVNRAIKDGVGCDGLAQVGNGATDDVSYTGFELLCLRELGFHNNGKTIWLDRVSGQDRTKPAGWQVVSRCTTKVSTDWDDYIK